MHADRLDTASLAAHGVALRRAALQHPHVTQGKIVTDGVTRIEAGERLRDLDRRSPGHVATRRPSEVPREPVNVDVDRNDEPARIDRPEPEIDAVGFPNHPAEEEEKSFRGAPRAWIAEQMRRAASSARIALSGCGKASFASKTIAKRRERLAKSQ